jgi:hypothetical protein
VENVLAVVSHGTRRGFSFRVIGMPFKNKADKAAWVKRHKANRPDLYLKWKQAAKERNAPVVAARNADRERMRREREAHREADLKAYEAERERIKDTCKHCGERKPEEFRVRPGTVERVCKRCRTRYATEWKKRNPQSVARSRKAREERIRSDPVRLLNTRLRQRIQKAIRRTGKGVTVAGGKLRYLGCTAQQATEYLERQFVGCMSWQNYGRAWHVDHIIPLVAFDLASEEGRKAAFHYSNIRPLWARANLRKNATISDKPHQPELLLHA